MQDHLTPLEIYTIGALFYVNVLNYLDRYTVAGVLNGLKEDFQIGDDLCGLLQTAFTISYLIFAPIFGYLGDRYSRRLILIGSLIMWSSAVFFSSFAQSYMTFFMLRMVVGVGEASFSAIAPTIICDVTYRSIRKANLAIFYIAIPIGSGMGFTIGSRLARITEHWSWGIRVTLPMGIIALILLIFIKDPIKGERDRAEEGMDIVDIQTSYREDLKHLSSNKSFILSTLGFTSVTFAIGALSWWGPRFLHMGFIQIPGLEDEKLDQVAFECGAMAIVAGVIGVPLGGYVSNRLIKTYPAIDPILCGMSLIVTDPLLVTAILLSNKCYLGTYLAIVIGETFMNCTWTIVADILLTCVVPEARATAQAFQITFAHMFGDAGSPYLVGLLTEILKVEFQGDTANIQEYKAMRCSFFSMNVMVLMGGLFFIANAKYVVEDKRAVLEAMFTVDQQSVRGSMRDDRRSYIRDSVRDDRRSYIRDSVRDDRRFYGRDSVRDDRRSYTRRSNYNA